MGCLAQRLLGGPLAPDHPLLPGPAPQVLIYQALGFPTPVFGHVSLILAPDKSKLSKRHGATSVGEFREEGYLAEVGGRARGEGGRVSARVCGWACVGGSVRWWARQLPATSVLLNGVASRQG